MSTQVDLLSLDHEGTLRLPPITEIHLGLGYGRTGHLRAYFSTFQIRSQGRVCLWLCPSSFVQLKLLGLDPETMAEQQVNLTDLEPTQLQEVKKQLDSVS